MRYSPSPREAQRSGERVGVRGSGRLNGNPLAASPGGMRAERRDAINVLVDVNIEYAEDAVAEPAQLNRAHLVVGAFHIGTVGAAIHFHHNMVLATEKVCEIVPDWRLAHEL